MKQNNNTSEGVDGWFFSVTDQNVFEWPKKN